MWVGLEMETPRDSETPLVGFAVLLVGDVGVGRPSVALSCQDGLGNVNWAGVATGPRCLWVTGPVTWVCLERTACAYSWCSIPGNKRPMLFWCQFFQEAKVTKLISKKTSLYFSS